MELSKNHYDMTDQNMDYCTLMQLGAITCAKIDVIKFIMI